MFIIEQIQQKLMTKFVFKYKKLYFWSISPIFEGKKFFQENVALSGTISYGFLALNQNSEKSNDRKKNGQTLLHKTPPATAGDLTSTTALEWHVKVK